MNTPKSIPCLQRIITILAVFSLMAGYAFGYSGGTGDPNHPYQIASVADLLILADDFNNYNKCFILTADLDLDPNLSGNKVFTTAVISRYDANIPYSPISFTGTFDGAGHNISNLTINGGSYLGLFGWVDALGKIKNIGLENVHITGWDYSSSIGGLAGGNSGTISNCRSTCIVSGGINLGCVGGLVGTNAADINNLLFKRVNHYRRFLSISWFELDRWAGGGERR